MRVATTEHGTKLHLIDPHTNDVQDERTTCGRDRVTWGVIEKPVKDQICQVCVKTSIARMTRFLGIPGKPTIKRKIRPRESSSSGDLKTTDPGGPRFVED